MNKKREIEKKLGLLSEYREVMKAIDTVKASDLKEELGGRFKCLDAYIVLIEERGGDVEKIKDGVIVLGYMCDYIENENVWIHDGIIYRKQEGTRYTYKPWLSLGSRDWKLILLGRYGLGIQVIRSSYSLVCDCLMETGILDIIGEIYESVYAYSVEYKDGIMSPGEFIAYSIEELEPGSLRGSYCHHYFDVSILSLYGEDLSTYKYVDIADADWSSEVECPDIRAQGKIRALMCVLSGVSEVEEERVMERWKKETSGIRYAKVFKEMLGRNYINSFAVLNSLGSTFCYVDCGLSGYGCNELIVYSI